MRNFAITDSIVLGQLHELERLAAQDCRDGDYRLIDILICAVIGTMKVLPEAISARIHTSFYVGSAHYDTTNAGRVKLWARLSAGLNDDLDRLAADPALADVDVSSRRKTRGEAILAACERLDAARASGEDMLSPAQKLKRVGAGTDAGSDGSELVRILSKKRIPDVHQHNYEISRLIHHARIVGGLFHNQPNDY